MSKRTLKILLVLVVFLIFTIGIYQVDGSDCFGYHIEYAWTTNTHIDGGTAICMPDPSVSFPWYGSVLNLF